MSFDSVLLQSRSDSPPEQQIVVPEFFRDLNLDQVVAAITAGKEEYNLNPFFYMPLHDVDAILFRHEIMQDLEDARLFESIEMFAQAMHTVREHLALIEKLHYALQKKRWFLDAVDTYCDAVTALLQDLCAATITSRGLLEFREFMSGYSRSESFTSLVEQTKKLTADLAATQYAVLINGDRVQVSHYGGEPDYSSEIEATFERFKQGAVKNYDFKFFDLPQMNDVEAQILAFVARLYPELFSRLETFHDANRDFQNGTVVTFDREIQFYIAYLDYIARFKGAGLHFCYPKVVEESKEVFSSEGFDLALAAKLIAESAAIVCNDFYLRGQERMIVVSGPNQGGKTTFARAFGQLHYLANLGCPVPGARGQFFLFDKLFTHFEREEEIKNLRGKLQDDLARIHEIVERATPDSVIIMNEIFTSTTLQDAVLLSKNIAAKLVALNLLCVWVTFIDELASLGEQTVSMVSTVLPENPATRTYKILRRPADGLAYAMAIAEKHRVTYPMIKERMGS